uniref:COesterase domain-containing protein n=1 Tax=Syphacia muris TaxID=451379 RepID=A0A0N5AGZ6_9BILA
MKVLLLLVLTAYVGQSQNISTVTVKTSKGLIRGRHINLGNNTSQLFYGEADIFLGIPYAKPPVGQLRFRVRIFSVWDAQKYAPQLMMSEDCLYLNVFTRQTSSANKHPVMIFIDGGNSFTTGGSNPKQMKGTIRNFVMRDIVVVTIQYRLGALGFFTTYNSEFPANLGLLDQVKAIEWVRREIHNFGGDPDEITLCGQNDGACSVKAHTLSPISQRLFKRAILQSGSIQGCFSITPEGGYIDIHVDDGTDRRININKEYFENFSTFLENKTLEDLGNQTEYSNSATSDIPFTACNMTAEEWRKGQLIWFSLENIFLIIKKEFFKYIYYAWMIVRDNYFMPDSVENLAKQRPHIPIIIGTVQDEDASYAFKLVANGEVSEDKNKVFNNWFADFARKQGVSGEDANKASLFNGISGIQNSRNVTKILRQMNVLQNDQQNSSPTPLYQQPTQGNLCQFEGHYLVQVSLPCYFNLPCNSNQNQPQYPPVSLDHANLTQSFPLNTNEYSSSNFLQYDIPQIISSPGKDINEEYSQPVNQYGTPNTLDENRINPPPVQTYQDSTIPPNCNREAVIEALKTITKVMLIVFNIYWISSDANVVSGTSKEINSLLSNGNTNVRVFEFAHVTQIVNQLCKNTTLITLNGKWAEFVKTGIISNWQPTTPQNNQYCKITVNPQMSQGYGATANTVFNELISRAQRQATQLGESRFPPAQQQQQQQHSNNQPQLSWSISLSLPDLIINF